VRVGPALRLRLRTGSVRLGTPGVRAFVRALAAFVSWRRGRRSPHAFARVRVGVADLCAVVARNSAHPDA